MSDFPKNAPNHPDFAPGKFGGLILAQNTSFWVKAGPETVYFSIKLNAWRADFSRYRPKITIYDDFSKNHPNHPDFALEKFGGLILAQNVSF